MGSLAHLEIFLCCTVRFRTNMHSSVVRKLKELYWTVSRAVGLQHVHGCEGKALRVAATKALYFIPAKSIGPKSAQRFPEKSRCGTMS